MKKVLLKKVAERIVRNARYFDMDSFYAPNGAEGDPKGASSREQCGTTACISKVTLDPLFELCPEYQRYEGVNWEAEGAKVLGLTSDQSNRLFYTDFWPENFRERYYRAKSKKVAACVAAERIKHFIKTEGTE